MNISLPKDLITAITSLAAKRRAAAASLPHVAIRVYGIGGDEFVIEAAQGGIHVSGKFSREELDNRYEWLCGLQLHPLDTVELTLSSTITVMSKVFRDFPVRATITLTPDGVKDFIRQIGEVRRTGKGTPLWTATVRGVEQ